MDRKFPQNPEIAHLLQISEEARACLDFEMTELKRRLDVPSRVRDSLKANPKAWLLGSAATGLIGSMIFQRKPSPEKKRRGIAGLLFGLTLTAVRPMAKVWLANQLKQWVSGLAASPRPFYPVAQPTQSSITR
ncbi:MAG: hypothetical protein H8M99_09825 [Gloeobacteraceae cyanobacterium ES-bin-144]|nr:hypothetical protein [Verrucomicrobiales bacterium]